MEETSTRAELRQAVRDEFQLWRKKKYMALTTSASTTATPVAAPSLQQMGGSTMFTTQQTGPNPNAVVGGLVDRRPWRYWDTFKWGLASPAVALPSSVALFTVPINQLDLYTGVRKTKLDTNMNASGMFNAPECLLMQQISIYICGGNTLAAINQFFENCWLEMKINQKIFWEGLPWMFPSGLGYMGQTAAADTAEFITNGLPAPQAAWKAGSFSKYIAPLQPFSVTFYFPGTPPTMASAFKLVLFLDGLADTAVQ